MHDVIQACIQSLHPRIGKTSDIISVSLQMSVITQDGDSPLMMAARYGRTEVVSLLVNAEAALDLQDMVNMTVALIPSLSNAVCDSYLTCVTIGHTP